MTFASSHYCGTKATPLGVWLAPSLCLQGNKTVKHVPVKEQPPIKVADLIAGATYHLRVYSHELNSISSKSITFMTKAGETSPGQAELGFQLGWWATLGASLSVVVCRNSVEVGWVNNGSFFLIHACSSKDKLRSFGILCLYALRLHFGFLSESRSFILRYFSVLWDFYDPETYCTLNWW